MHRIILLVLALIPAASVFADGTRLPAQDLEAVGRGYAFAATADTPAAIYYNPAGSAQLKDGAVEAGAYLIRPSVDFHGASGQTSSAKTETFTLPYLFAVQPVPVGGHTLVVGAGAYAPFGLSSNWDPNTTGFRTLATNASLVYRRYALSAATKVSDQLLVGASLQYNRAHLDISRGIGFAPGDQINLTARGDAWSYNVGALYQPSPMHAFGLQYQGRGDVTIDGATSYSPLGFSEPSTVHRWPFPDNFTFSYSFRPAPEWNFEVGYDQTNWSCLRTVVVNRAVQGPLPLVFDWKDSAYYEFGGTHYWNNGWHLSAGGCWSQNSVPDATYNPAVPDYDRLIWDTAIGYRTGGFKVTLLLQYSPARSRTVSGSLRSPAGESADGTYTGKFIGGGLQFVASW